MKANYYALLAIILNAKLTVEQALTRMGLTIHVARVNNTAFGKQFKELRDRGMKWREIGDLFGISADAAHRRMKYYLQTGGAKA